MGVFENFFLSINLFGLGSEPLALAFALMVTVLVTREELKRSKYTNSAICFVMTYAIMFTIGLARNLELFVTISVLLGIGALLSEGIKVKLWG